MLSLTTARAIVCAGCAVALLTVLLTARGRFVSARNPYAFPLAALWLSPLALYWYLIRTVVGAWLIGIGFAALAGYYLTTIYRSKGSTAAIGFLWAPVILWAAMIPAVGIDWVVGTVIKS